MGGGRFPYPKHVWAPTGGWWHEPKNANSNFVKVFTGAAIITFIVFKFGQSKEYIPQREYEKETIDKWEAAARKANEDAGV